MSEHLLRARERKGKIKRERDGTAHVNRDLALLLSHSFNRGGHVLYTLRIMDPAAIISGNNIFTHLNV